MYNQTAEHLSRSGLYPLLQSAYRTGHSTETALLKVQNDILLAMDRQHITPLVLLDLSAAFDTVDHQALLYHLEVTYRITGTALQWFRSQCKQVNSSRFSRLISQKSMLMQTTPRYIYCSCRIPPFPCSQDSFEALLGASWFPNLDLASGLQKVAMDDDKKAKTAFTTPFGPFEYNRTPFGLCNVPTSFARLMQACVNKHIFHILLVYHPVLLTDL